MYTDELHSFSVMHVDATINWVIFCDCFDVITIISDIRHQSLFLLLLLPFFFWHVVCTVPLMILILNWETYSSYHKIFLHPYNQIFSFFYVTVRRYIIWQQRGKGGILVVVCRSGHLIVGILGGMCLLCGCLMLQCILWRHDVQKEKKNEGRKTLLVNALCD